VPANAKPTATPANIVAIVERLILNLR